MPFWVILLGVLVSGYAFRYVLGDVSKNMAYQLHLIQQAYEELAETQAFPDNPASEDIKDMLVDAEAALHWNDFAKAAAHLKNATDKLALLKEVESKLAQAKRTPGSQENSDVKMAVAAYWKGELANAKVHLDKFLESPRTALEDEKVEEPAARIAVQIQPGSFFYPAGAALPLVRPAGASFRLYRSPANTSSPLDKDLVWNVQWSIARRGDPFEPLAGVATQTLPFTQIGKFVLKAKEVGTGKEVSLEIHVSEDRAIVALRNRALLSTGIWAVIASVAGLLYIEARLPTFGAPQDYLLALGWALGLGVASKPTESLIATVLKALSGKEPAPTAAGQPPATTTATTKPDQPDTTTSGEVEVPKLEEKMTLKQVEERLKQSGLKLDSEPADAGEDWIIVPDSVAPKPGEPAGAEKQVKAKFTEPPKKGEKTGEEESSEGD
jgi:hypothetical protein